MEFSMPGFDSSSLENVIHVIQVALTPVFLLTALAALLNVFSEAWIHADQKSMRRVAVSASELPI